jgi:hypothetical protein
MSMLAERLASWGDPCRSIWGEFASKLKLQGLAQSACRKDVQIETERAGSWCDGGWGFDAAVGRMA